MRSALRAATRAISPAALAGLRAALVWSTMSTQAAAATISTGSKNESQALAASTTPLRTPSAALAAAGRMDATSVLDTSPVPTAVAAGSNPKAVRSMAPMPRRSPAVANAEVSALGPDFVWVPEPAGPQLRRHVTGGERTEKTTYTHRRTGKPVSQLTITKGEPPPADVDDRPRPRVWCVPATEHVSPINGNLLRDGHLGYEDGSLMLGHHFSNEIWNAPEKTVRVACDKDWAAGFQLITELEGKQRRIQILADDLDGPRVLPAGPCVKISRLWYIRGKNGRDVDGWWDEPLTLIPLLRPLNVPPPDNDVVGQTNQSFFVNIHIPLRVFAGTYRTTLHVTDLDDSLYDEDIHVEVAARPTGARPR